MKREDIVKKLVVNADDFGLSEGINRGIADAFQNGILTSASLLATMPAFHHAVTLALEKELDVGIHVSLTVGEPCSGNKKLAPILKNGRFIQSYRHLLMHIYSGSIRPEDLKHEIASQIVKIRETGLKPSHLNGHQHVLMAPRLFKLTLELMKENRIPFVRIPAEIVSLSELGSAKGWGFLALACLSRFRKRKMDRMPNIFGTVDHFFGLSFSERMTQENLIRTLVSLKPGVSELMCHPGCEDHAFHQIYGNRFYRERELRALKDARVLECVKTNQIKLVSFRDLWAKRSRNSS